MRRSSTLTARLSWAVRQMRAEALETTRYFRKRGKRPPHWTQETIVRAAPALDYLARRSKRAKQGVLTP